MLELILEIILEPLLEVGGQLVIELLIELGVKAAFATKERRNMTLALLGWLSVGLGLGGLSSWLRPAAVLPDVMAVRIAALVLIPVLVGLGMAAYGRFARQRGRLPTTLATFHGGVALSFGITLVRHLSHGAFR